MLLNIIRKVLYQEDLGRKVAKQPETPLLRVGLTSTFSSLLASSCSSTNWLQTSKKALQEDPICHNSETFTRAVCVSCRQKPVDDIKQVSHLRDTGSEIPYLRCHSLLALRWLWGSKQNKDSELWPAFTHLHPFADLHSDYVGQTCFSFLLSGI